MQTWIDAKAKQPKHPMEEFTAPTELARQQSTTGPTYQMLAVYVDDFLMEAMENKTRTILQCMAWAMLDAIYGLFQPPAATERPDAKDAVLETKLAKEDAC